MVLINNRKLKIGFGYYLISSTFCLLIYIITEMVTERPIQTPIILNFMSYDQILFLNYINLTASSSLQLRHEEARCGELECIENIRFGSCLNRYNKLLLRNFNISCLNCLL